jgi:2-haloacid dehalogenase
MERDAVVPGAVDAVVFDVIGTLVQEDDTWAKAAEGLAAATGVADAEALCASWVGGLDRHMDAVVRGAVPWRPHRELVGDAAREAIAAAGGTPAEAAVASLASLEHRYPAWPDVASATAALRRDRLVAGLSNGDLDALARLANANAISWDIALSTGTVRTFKPAPAAYLHAIDALRLDPARTLFTAAHPWDLRAAAEHGFRTAYVARPGAERPSPEDRFDLAVDDLAALVRLLGPAGADPSGRRRPA